jgi:hypothetical protein
MDPLMEVINKSHNEFKHYQQNSPYMAVSPQPLSFRAYINFLESFSKFMKDPLDKDHINFDELEHQVAHYQVYFIKASDS